MIVTPLLIVQHRPSKVLRPFACGERWSGVLQNRLWRKRSDDPVLLDIAYATWRTSPMGLGGRDPIFYAQLASETETFHPDEAGTIPDICLGCHGVLGQRQHGIDTFESDGSCAPFSRELVDAVPWPADAPAAVNAKYGALARDGISCTACHHMVLGDADSAANRGAPQNHCVDQRQALLNPDNTGFARTSTGSFLAGPPDRLYGPFEDPKAKPMEHALGIEPAHYAKIELSELCGTCHTVPPIPCRFGSPLRSSSSSRSGCCSIR